MLVTTERAFGLIFLVSHGRYLNTGNVNKIKQAEIIGHKYNMLSFL